MACRLLSGLAVIMVTVWTGADMKVMNGTFSCCDLPLKIHLNHTFNSFSIGKKQLVHTNASVIEAKQPFAKVGNATLALDACEDFEQDSYNITKDGLINEDRITHYSQPCNESAWDRHKAVIAVSLVLVVGAGFGVWFFVTKKGCERSRGGGGAVI